MKNILCGPEFISKFPDVSIGKLFFEHFKQCKEYDEILVDGVTKTGITNKDIYGRSIKLAMVLKKLGVVQGDVVGISSPNHIEYLVPVLASFYLGAIVHPINPVYTLYEIQNTFDITKPKIIFNCESTLKSFKTLRNQRDYLEKIIVFDSTEQGQDNVYNYRDLLQEETGNIQDFSPAEVSPDSALCVLGSSGTTGFPKGVMISNSNFRFSLNYLGETHIGLKHGLSLIGLMPFFHIFGFLVGLGSLMYGVRNVLMQKFVPNLYLQLIQDYKTPILFLVPTIAQFLAKSETVLSYDLSNLKEIHCGAAPLGEEVHNLLINRLSVKIKQLYGMTETCGCMTITPDDDDGKCGNSGQVIHGLQLKVEDMETHEILGANKVGEICCKGVAVTLGYCGNRKAWEDMLDDDGFLHTGDVGYYDEEGFLYVIDRMKELIKYKGFQVSPSELEDILISHEGIKEVGVVGIPDQRCGELPMAFVVRQEGSDVEEKEINEYLADFVCEQKHLHGGIRFVDEIPKGNTGKILRRKLREMI